MRIDYKKHPDPKAQLRDILAGKGTTFLPDPFPGSVEIVLPMPPKESHPNARVNYHRFAKVKKQQKADCVLACIAQKVPRARLTTATAWSVFCFTTKRDRDIDNLAAWLKATWDGLVAYGLLADDKGLTPLPPLVEIGPVAQLRIKVFVALALSPERDDE